MSALVTDPLTFLPKDDDKKLWMELPKHDDHSSMDSNFLVYSNEETFQNYLDNNLWSESFSTMEQAEMYDVYTDGYAARALVNFPVTMLDENEDGFGFFFSEHGEQQVNEEDEPADGTEIVWDEREVQGWNGFAIHRVGNEVFTFDNYHFEKDEITSSLDLYALLPEDFFPGSWVNSSMVKDPTGTYYTWTADRYLPKWQYGDSVWDNDYRYSPESPAISVKGYYRDNNQNSVEIIQWSDITQLNIKGAVSLAATTFSALALSLFF